MKIALCRWTQTAASRYISKLAPTSKDDLIAPNLKACGWKTETTWSMQSQTRKFSEISARNYTHWTDLNCIHLKMFDRSYSELFCLKFWIPFFHWRTLNAIPLTILSSIASPSPINRGRHVKYDTPENNSIPHLWHRSIVTSASDQLPLSSGSSKSTRLQTLESAAAPSRHSVSHKFHLPIELHERNTRTRKYNAFTPMIANR